MRLSGRIALISGAEVFGHNSRTGSMETLTGLTKNHHAPDPVRPAMMHVVADCTQRPRRRGHPPSQVQRLVSRQRSYPQCGKGLCRRRSHTN